jgi:hypothetical protein
VGISGIGAAILNSLPATGRKSTFIVSRITSAVSVYKFNASFLVPGCFVVWSLFAIQHVSSPTFRNLKNIEKHPE